MASVSAPPRSRPSLRNIFQRSSKLAAPGPTSTTLETVPYTSTKHEAAPRIGSFPLLGNRPVLLNFHESDALEARVASDADHLDWDRSLVADQPPQLSVLSLDDGRPLVRENEVRHGSSSSEDSASDSSRTRRQICADPASQLSPMVPSASNAGPPFVIPTRISSLRPGRTIASTSAFTRTTASLSSSGSSDWAGLAPRSSSVSSPIDGNVPATIVADKSYLDSENRRIGYDDRKNPQLRHKKPLTVSRAASPSLSPPGVVDFDIAAALALDPSSLDQPIPLPYTPSVTPAVDQHVDGLVDLPSPHEDVTIERHYAVPVVHETIQPHIHHVHEKHIVREIHQTHIYHRILPLVDVEYKPPRHFIHVPRAGRETSTDGDTGATLTDEEKAQQNPDEDVIEVSEAEVPAYLAAAGGISSSSVTYTSSSSPIPGPATSQSYPPVEGIPAPPPWPKEKLTNLAGLREFSAREILDHERTGRSWVDENGMERSESWHFYPPELRGMRVVGPGWEQGDANEDTNLDSLYANEDVSALEHGDEIEEVAAIRKWPANASGSVTKPLQSPSP